jgi:hypothetical protein
LTTSLGINAFVVPSKGRNPTTSAFKPLDKAYIVRYWVQRPVRRLVEQVNAGGRAIGMVPGLDATVDRLGCILAVVVTTILDLHGT